MNQEKEIVRNFIWSNYLKGKFTVNLEDSTRLRTSGLMDSLSTLGLITFVEKQFDLEFSALELTVDNFDTIDQIISLVTRKMVREAA